MIDCEVNRVIQKYTHPGEDFYALCWLQLPDALVLAAAGLMSLDQTSVTYSRQTGLLGSIKLIDHRQHVCYEQLYGHGPLVSALAALPTQPSILLSASCTARLCLVTRCRCR